MQVARLSDASIDVMARGFDGWEEYDRIAEEYHNEPWMQDLDGTTIGAFEQYPHWVVRLVGPFMAPGELIWDYTSHRALDILHERNVPVVWQIAAEDRSAPNGPTLAEVQRRMVAGQNHHLQVYPNTDHGFVLFTEDATGTRSYGNYHPDYFQTEVNWVRLLTGLDGPDQP